MSSEKLVSKLGYFSPANKSKCCVIDDKCPDHQTNNFKIN